MGIVSFKSGEDFALRISKLAKNADKCAERALKAAAAVVTDKVRANLTALPTDYRVGAGKEYYYLTQSEKFDGVPLAQKEDLLNSLGFTPVGLDKDGNYNIKIGFDGYGRQPTQKYPRGIPNQLVARAVESGSSVREKHPFVRPASRSAKDAAIRAMDAVIAEEAEKTK